MLGSFQPTGGNAEGAEDQGTVENNEEKKQTRKNLQDADGQPLAMKSPKRFRYFQSDRSQHDWRNDR